MLEALFKLCDQCGYMMQGIHDDVEVHLAEANTYRMRINTLHAMACLSKDASVVTNLHKEIERLQKEQECLAKRVDT